MKLMDIPLADIYAGRNWTLKFDEGGDPNNPEVVESIEFFSTDVGLFSGLLKFADGSRHPALIVKSFEHGGESIATYVYTRMGWLNVQTDGLMRVMAKYSHDIFPFDAYLASPVEMDTEIADKAAEHKRVFQDSLEQLKSMRYDLPSTQTRRRLIPGTGPS